MRSAIIVGAQKLYLGHAQAQAFARALVERVDGMGPIAFEVGVCPSLVNLAAVGAVVRGSKVALGAQNLHHGALGAHTGQVAAPELVEVGATMVIVGHSELRAEQRETNEIVRDKVALCLDHGLAPILCIGESREDREAGRSGEVVARDLEVALAEVTGDHPVERLIVAYEPIWAIKRGRDDTTTRAATPDDIDPIHALIRARLTARLGDRAEAVRVLYGGSVNKDNAGGYLELPTVDGLLVGSASVDLEQLAGILTLARGLSAAR